METIQKRVTEFFEFERHNAKKKTEIIAGLSTFLALSYIFVVNPSILAEGGFNKNAALFATILISALATIAMGLWAKKPFALAPGMEMNAYVTFFVIAGLGFGWQQALGAVLWSGVIFLLLTVTSIREKIILAIPDHMKSGIALCVGVFLILIALQLAGGLIYQGVVLDGLGTLVSTEGAVFAIGLFLLLLLKKLKVPGAVLLSIIIAAVAAHLLGIGVVAEPIRLSGDMLSALGQLDIGVIADPRMWSVILILFLVDFYGSVAKFIGLTQNTTIVDQDGKMPQMQEALYVDGAATVVGAVVGTTSLTTYVESGVGISEGGRTGLTAVVTGIAMLTVFIAAPLINLVPVIATTGALAWVGISLFPKKEQLKKYSAVDILTVLVMIGVTIATFAIDKALLFGFLVYIIGLCVSRRQKEINLYIVISTMLLTAGLFLSLYMN